MVADGLAPVRLRAEHLDRALGLPTTQPRLSWQLPGSPDGRETVACQIHAAARLADLLNGKPGLWDSGWRPAAPRRLAPWAGRPLAPRDHVYWRVRAKLDDGRVTAWSEPARFSIGLLSPGDWAAAWIGPSDYRSGGPCPLLEKRFALEAPVVRATLHITALGLYDAQLNGRPVGEGRLLPGWTDYTRRVPVQTFDVTDLLAAGPHVLRVTLAEGWYGGQLGWIEKGHVFNYGPPPPRLLLQLECETADGCTRTIVSDETWRWVASGVLSASLYFGQTEDRGRTRQLDDEHENGQPWAAVAVFGPPAGRLTPQPDPPITVAQDVGPRRITTTADGAALIDFGQNLAGVCRLAFHEPAGTVIELRHGEALNEDGSLHRANLRMAVACDRATSAGVADVFEPRFTYHGFRYAEVRGLRRPPRPDEVAARVLHSDCDDTFELTSSCSLVNRLHEVCRWALKSNLVGVLTDCPQRDERFGWLGDAAAFAPAACSLMDLSAVLPKVCDDIADAQHDHGVFPDIAPWVPGVIDAHGAPGYMDGAAVFPWLAWRRYGDLRPAQTLLPGLLKYLRYVESQNPGDLWENQRGTDYGDWVSPRPGADKTQIASLMWLRTAQLTTAMARALGDDDASRNAASLADRIAKAFNRRYLTDAGYEPASQATAAVALGLGVVPDDHQRTVMRQLARLVEDNGRRLHTGMIATPYLLPALSRHGRHDLALALLLQRESPSWAYWLDRGATTLWERWDADRQPPEMNSRNHFAFGSVFDWMVSDLVGLRPGSPGYASVVFRPAWPRVRHEELHAVDATYHSACGPVRFAWEDRAESVEVCFGLPPGVAGQLVSPPGFRPVEGPDRVAARDGGRVLPLRGAGRLRFARLPASHDLDVTIAIDPARTLTQTDESLG